MCCAVEQKQHVLLVRMEDETSLPSCLLEYYLYYLYGKSMSIFILLDLISFISDLSLILTYVEALSLNQ
jgi:hypothetical protein